MASEHEPQAPTIEQLQAQMEEINEHNKSLAVQLDEVRAEVAGLTVDKERLENQLHQNDIVPVTYQEAADDVIEPIQVDEDVAPVNDPSEAPTVVTPIIPRAPRQERKGFGKKLKRALAIGALAVGGLLTAGAVYGASTNGDREAVSNNKTEQADNATTATPAPAITGGNGGNMSGDSLLIGGTTPLEQAAAAHKKAEEDAAAKAKKADAAKNTTPKWVTAPTVNSATLRMPNGTVAHLKKDQVPAIFDAKSKINSNAHGKMASMESFTPESMTTIDMIQGAMFASDAQKAYASGIYNNVHGKAALTATEASHAQMKKSIEAAITSKDTKIENARISGTFLNHGINAEGDLFAQQLTASDIRVTKVTLPNGNVIYLKVGGGNDSSGAPCINILEKIGTPSISVTTTPRGEGGPSTTSTNTPRKPHTVAKVVFDKVHVNFDKPNKTTDGDNTPEKPNTPPPTPGKEDHKVTPAGEPRNPGTPDEAGVGPAGQKPDAAGFVPGEKHPATPAPEPTPAPLPEAGPEPTAPGAGTGDVITQPTTPAVQSDGGEKPTPSQNVEL